MYYDNPFSSLPNSWQEEIRRLRRESAKLRRERNEARDQVGALGAALAAAVTSA